jgi:hypothetical protein
LDFGDFVCWSPGPPLFSDFPQRHVFFFLSKKINKPYHYPPQGSDLELTVYPISVYA